jgi:hypothetical protein
VGKLVGAFEGILVGGFVGALVGAFVGALVGAFVGCLVGAFVGALVGNRVGVFVGGLRGRLVGGLVGRFLGRIVGMRVGHRTPGRWHLGTARWRSPAPPFPRRPGNPSLGTSRWDVPPSPSTVVATDAITAQKRTLSFMLAEIFVLRPEKWKHRAAYGPAPSWIHGRNEGSEWRSFPSKEAFTTTCLAAQ